MYELITSNPLAAVMFAVVLGSAFSSCVFLGMYAWARIMDWWNGDD